MYNSRESRNLYQSNPVYSTENGHKDHTFTTSISGYKYAAHKQASFLYENQKIKPNNWFLTINFHKIQSLESLKEHKKIWKNCCRNFERLGIDAVWSIEISRSNRLHYHLLINSKHSQKQVLEILKRSMPYTKSGKQDGWHKCLEPVKDWGLPSYIMKAKIEGEINGVIVKDYYANKRILFKPNLPIRKHGKIGDYWAIDTKAKKAHWDKVIVTEKQIWQGLADERVKEYAKEIHEKLLVSEMSLKQVQRQYGYFGLWDKSKPVIDGYEAEEIE